MDSQQILEKVMTMLSETSRAVAILVIGQRIVDAQSESERAFLAQALARLTETQQPLPNNVGQGYQEQYQPDMFYHH